MKLSLLVENKTYEENIHAEHGLSLLIETDERTILFDSGQSNAMLTNAKNMGIDLSSVDLAVLSHGHYDHSGGFPAFGKINKDAPIYIHEKAVRESYEKNKQGKPVGTNLGVLWTESEKEELKNQINYTNQPVHITENIIISGSIPKPMREFKTTGFLYKEGNRYSNDEMDHEQFLIVRENGHLNVFSGCSHTGVKPIIDYTKELCPNEKIKMLFGGFHLYESPLDKLLNESERICSLDVEYFLPVHCTGLKATFKMQELLGDRCIIMNAGDKLFI